VALINLYFAWAWILTGMVMGAVIGVFFHRHDWLGGFASWPRRMVRLAHIAFLGTGLLNLAFALSVPHVLPSGDRDAALRAAAALLIVGAVTMPTVCLLAAWRAGCRRLFFIPALSLIAAIGVFLCRGFVQ